MKVLVTSRWPNKIEKYLCQKDLQITWIKDRALLQHELIEALCQYDVILPTITDVINGEMLQSAHTLRTRFIGIYGAGYDNVDVAQAQKLGITVTNTPNVITEDTADLTLTLLLMVARGVVSLQKDLYSGQWSGWTPTYGLSQRIYGKTLGIVGMGSIGRAVAHRAAYGFGMKVVYYNRSVVECENSYVAMKSPEEVCSVSDFVSVHCSHKVGRPPVINREVLTCLQPHAFFINTARGAVVDEDVLLSLLEQGKIAGAGLDVYQGEPHINPRFLSLKNVVLLPHAGSATYEGREAMGMCVMDNLEAFLEGKTPPCTIHLSGEKKNGA